MGIRSYEEDIKIFAGMPLTFQGNNIGHVVGISGNVIRFCTDNKYMQELLRNGAKFTLDIGLKER